MKREKKSGLSRSTRRSAGDLRSSARMLSLRTRSMSSSSVTSEGAGATTLLIASVMAFKILRRCWSSDMSIFHSSAICGRESLEQRCTHR